MEYFNVAKIVNTQGLKGEVRTQVLTDFPDQRLKKGKTVYAFVDDKILPLEIDGSRKHKSFELLHFKGYDSINDVEFLKPSFLKIKEDQLDDIDLQPGAYFYHQIIGLPVFDEEDNKLGIVKEIMDLGPNDVWVVKRDGQKDLLLPKIDDVIKQVDLDKQKIIVDVLEGLD
ncbi:ribosome maturation factor RimM [Fructilactobacillus vespulae]|uniref:ribosome maturation factor RimM n=1 Tax=Fructilactobacillus vespulae TaxID=1249630 RepID=UPI0039B4F18F